MRRLLLLLLAAAAGLQTTVAQNYVTIGGLRYTLSATNKTARLEPPKQYADYSGNIVVPSKVTYQGQQYTVSDINGGAFSKTYVTSVTIPATITTAGGYANCTKLKTVNIPGATYISHDSFSGSSVENVNMPSVKEIGQYAFKDCKNLKSIVLPEGLQTIAHGSFQGTGITSVTFPSTIKSIGGYLFSGCNITSVTFAGNISSEDFYGFLEGITSESITVHSTAVGHYWFKENTTLKKVVLDKNVREIGVYAFKDCTSLKEIQLNEGLTKIKGAAFENCKFTSIKLPESLTEIGGSAFSGCSELTSIIIPKNITTIQYYAFSGCPIANVEFHCSTIGNWFAFSKTLTTITIGKEVKAIVAEAFDRCITLKSVKTGEGLTTIGNKAFQDCTSLSDISLPESLSSIGQSAFTRCTALESITLPKGLKDIGTSAFSNSGLRTVEVNCPIIGEKCFYNCDSLINLTFNNGVKEIGNEAFLSCDSLKTVKLPEGVTAIGAQSFYGSGIETLSIPKTLTTIGYNAFSSLGSLQTVISYIKNPTSVVSDFGKRYKVATLYVPYGRKPLYQKLTTWKNFLDIEEMDPEPGDVTGVTLNKTETSIFVGKTEQLLATVLPADANDKSVTWTTSDKNIATVTADGTVTAIKPGTVNITCSSVDNESKTATCIVTVLPVPVTGIAISKSAISIVKGQTEKLEATITPDNATVKNVTWTSSNPDIAYVSSDGTVSARSIGTATITCTLVDNEAKTAICIVNVVPTSVEALTLNKTAVKLLLGKTEQLTPTITPADATNKNVTWTTSDASIATVSSSGLVKAIGKGTAVITCTSDDDATKVATCTVSVDMIGVTRISLNYTNLTVEENDGEWLEYTVFPSNASDRSVVWESSDTTVATVERGLVHPQLHGECVITCRSVSNPEVYASCKVTVKAWIVNFFVIPSEIGLTESWTNPEITLVISTKDLRVIWTSMDESIATVDERGYVTGIKAGKTKVVCTSVADPTRFITRDVEVYPAQIVIEKPLLIMNVGDQDTLKHYVYHPDYASQEVTWSSSDTNIATVDTAGLVTAVGGGRALITATWKWNPERKESRIVYVSPVLTPAIPPTEVFGEYFFDRDPGYGKASSLPMADWGSSDYALSTAGIAPGAHILYLRCRDEYGRWSATVSRPMCVLSYPDIVAAEYFFDNESAGIGQRKPITLPDGKFRELTFDVETEGLTPGRHQLTVRIMDKFGRWSIASSEPITVTKSGTGIATVTTDFAIAINATRGRCTLSDLDLGNRNDCRVEIYDAAGRTLAVTLWKRAETEKALPVSAAEGSVLVVKVSDTANGRQLTRRIIVK